MKNNIMDLEKKAKAMVLGTEFTVTCIEITNPKVSGKRLGNSKSRLKHERAIVVTAYDSKNREFVAFEFPTLQQFDNQFERAIENLKGSTDKYNYLTKSSVTTFKIICPPVVRSTAEIHAAEDRWADVVFEEDRDNDNDDNYRWDFSC